MSQRYSPVAFALIASLAVSACGDGMMGNEPVDPPRGAPLGIIRGTVSGDSMTAEYVPIGALGAVNSALSPAIYGGPTSVKVTGTFVSLVDNIPLNNRVWTFNVHMRNLLSNPIGSNYAATNPAPPDTSGVFIGFTTPPVVTFPTPCSCVAAPTNYAGIGNFTNPMQPFFWYKNRPTAVQGVPGTDQTGDVPWQFTGTFKPVSGDTVHSFTFVLIVQAAWPIGTGGDTAWSYNYSGSTDSLPDLVAKPRWKPPFVQLKNYTNLGSEAWNPGVDLVLTAGPNNSAIYIARNDSMNVAKSASIEVTARLGNVVTGVPIQAVFGYAEPGGIQAIVGIYEDHVAFVHLNTLTGQWSDIGAGPSFRFNLDATQSHVYRIRKFGTLDIHLCVDHTAVIAMLPGLLDPTAADFSTSTVLYGALRDNKGPVDLHVTNVNYQIGTDGGGC